MYAEILWTCPGMITAIAVNQFHNRNKGVKMLGHSNTTTVLLFIYK